MQQTRRISLLRSLFAARPSQFEPKKAIQPLDERQLARIAGGAGETSLPKGGWNATGETGLPKGGWSGSGETNLPKGGWN
jgi:hypothetical protein